MENRNLRLNKYSVGSGTGSRTRPKRSCRLACRLWRNGVEVIPVWNKSNREHTIIGSEPSSVRQAADAAVKALHWKLPYFCDADHITLQTVGRFLDRAISTPSTWPTSSASRAGRRPRNFVKRHPELLGRIPLEGADEAFEITQEHLRQTAQKFLAAVKKAGEVYRKIENAKGGQLHREVSMDETDRAQSPAELLIILAAIADEGIPVQTIAPKFSGRFNKGVDYVGDVAQFEREIALDVAAIAYAVRHFGLPDNLKLSVHSGSDKFSIYPAIHATMKRFNAGVHLKTAGTTWLEELIGLAEAGGDGLALAKEIYAQAFAHRDELCAPYATVIDIDPAKIPSPDEFAAGPRSNTPRPCATCREAAAYNSSLRQLLHVGFKIAAKMGRRYLELLEANEAVIAKNVTENLYDRHIAPVFLGRAAKLSAQWQDAEQRSPFWK
jgi:hypothetical protein